MRDRLYVHIVWTTRGRAPTIDSRVATFLARYLPAVARQERAGVHAMGIVRTHVHLLLQLHPTTSVSRLLQRLKGGSSVLANREGHAGPRPEFAFAPRLIAAESRVSADLSPMVTSSVASRDR